MRIARITILATFASLLAGSAGYAQELSIQDALRLALENNPRISSARAAARSADADRRLADSAAGPRVGVAASYTWLSKPTTFFGEEIFAENTQVNMLTLQMPVFSRQISRSRQAARLAGQAAEVSVDAVSQEVLLNVAERFWMIPAAREQAKAAEDAAGFLEANLRLVQAMREQGAATGGDVLRAEAELALARDRLLSAQNSVPLAMSALKMAMGLDQDADVSVSEVALEPEPGVEGVEARPSPAATAAEKGIEAARARVRAARAGNDPQVFLEADAMDITRGAEFPRMDGSVQAMVRISMPIFDSGTTGAEVAKAEAQADAAESQLRAIQDEVAFYERSTALMLDNARARYVATQQQVEAAIANRDRINIGAREGLFTQTEVLSAQSTVSNAQASRIQSLVDLKVAEAARLAAINRMDLLLGESD